MLESRMPGLFDLENSELHPWSMIHSQGSKIHEAIKRKWLQLLNDESCDANVYREFLAKCAILFFDRVDTTRSIVISGLELGNELVVDFAVTENRFSIGIDYHLFKIGTPHKSAFTESGLASETLTNAIDEIEHWKSWINGNENAVNRLFPSRDSPNFTYWIVIGLHTPNRVELRYNAADSVVVASFDYFTQSLESMSFDDIIRTLHSGWDDAISLLVIRNKISNPFFKALSHKDWSKITQRNFAGIHVIACNAELLLEYLEDNGLTKTFVEIWRSLPEETQNSYLECLR